jgi:diacylglycerol kinase family enzyme
VAGRTLVIVNPKSRGGATGHRWPAVEAKLRDALGRLDVEMTRGPRDAERIAREGVRAGAELVIAAGGDGTASEVVAGILGAGLGAYAEVAMLPLGTGGDLGRTLGASERSERAASRRRAKFIGWGVDEARLDDAIARIAAGKSRPIDAGRARFVARDGREIATHFVNIASLGLSGLVTQLVNEAPKTLGGRASFFIGTLRAIARWHAVPVAIRLDGALVHDGLLHLACVANGRYFGGGMHAAPDARVDDGVFDLVLFRGDCAKSYLLRKFPLIYSGKHLALAEVSQQRGVVVEASSSADLWLEIDGEPLGRAPARFECLPGALRLRGSDA